MPMSWSPWPRPQLLDPAPVSRLSLDMQFRLFSICCCRSRGTKRSISSDVMPRSIDRSALGSRRWYPVGAISTVATWPSRLYSALRTMPWPAAKRCMKGSPYRPSRSAAVAEWAHTATNMHMTNRAKGMTPLYPTPNYRTLFQIPTSTFPALVQRPRWRRLRPNATYYSQNCESDRNCGADPQVRAGPPGPVAATTISTSCKGREGRRGRRPRSRGDCPTIRQMFGNGISKWHWASACHVGTHADTLPAPFTPAHGEPPVSYKIPIPPSKSKPPDRHDKLNKMSDAGQPLLVEPTIDSDGVA